MADVLQTLEAEVSRMLVGIRRLSDDNIALRAELQAASLARRQLEARLDEARSRVESALDRLPALAAADSRASPLQTVPPITSLSAPLSTPPSAPPSPSLSKAD
jgi:uncharacterized protein (TIGR02449 family)